MNAREDCHHRVSLPKSRKRFLQRVPERGNLASTRGKSPAEGALQAAEESRTTVGQIFRQMAADFRAAGLETAGLDARVLVCAACGLSHEAFAGHPERPITPREYERAAGFRMRRLEREPVSRILGRREFRGLEFAIVPETLDPRPDTETLVEAALALAGVPVKNGAPLSILDPGTGSGCILLTLLHALPSATGLGTDVSAAALATARANAWRLGLSGRARFMCGSWLDAVAGRFDVIVCNPPYVRSSDIAGLAAEVADFEPRLALDGGSDGLEAYRRIVPCLPRVLAPGGRAVLEVGAGQADAVNALMSAAGLECPAENTKVWRDLSGVHRVVSATRR